MQLGQANDVRLPCAVALRLKLFTKVIPGRDLLRRELAQFVFKTGAQGQLRMEAGRGQDDLVIAAALAVLAADLWKSRSVSRSHS